MDRQTAADLLERIRAARAKQADATGGTAFADAVQNMSASQLKADALRDVGAMGLTSLGVGAAGAGLAGLINLIKRNRAQKKLRSGPALLPLPYPVEPAEAPNRVLKAANFLAGDAASSKAGVPWYGPAMMLTGLAGLGLGWKGVDSVLQARRRAETEDELNKARQDFHDALLSQYDKPLRASGKTAADSTMRAVGTGLDEAFQTLTQLFTQPLTKQAVDWGNLGGATLGGYGMYAGLSGLLTGALIYDKMQKRSRRAVLEKALQRRQRRRFMQSPTEIYAVPEPVTRTPQLGLPEERKLLQGPPPETE